MISFQIIFAITTGGFECYDSKRELKFDKVPSLKEFKRTVENALSNEVKRKWEQMGVYDQLPEVHVYCESMVEKDDELKSWKPAKKIEPNFYVFYRFKKETLTALQDASLKSIRRCSQTHDGECDNIKVNEYCKKWNPSLDEFDILINVFPLPKSINRSYIYESNLKKIWKNYTDSKKFFNNPENKKIERIAENYRDCEKVLKTFVVHNSNYMNYFDSIEDFGTYTEILNKYIPLGLQSKRN